MMMINNKERNIHYFNIPWNKGEEKKGKKIIHVT